MALDFVLPDDKIDSAGGSAPVANPTRKWSPNDANRVFGALEGLRASALANPVNVLEFGAVGNGVIDDTAAIQAAIDASAGRTLYFPKGKYRVTATLHISARSMHLVGDFAGRNTESGTEIAYSGAGPCIEIGTDSGNPWDSNEYDGHQDHVFAHLAIRHSAPDTALIAAGDAVLRIRLGSYGIWDWRGGGITMHRMLLEQFEANFVGIQSDINTFVDVTSNYSKYGFYIGPRSDQNTISQMYAISCDRAITVDRAGGLRIEKSHFVACGHNTAANIEIRRGGGVGPHGTTIDRCWFERISGGYQGADGLGFVQVGVVNGYGAGGSIQAPGGAPTTGTVVGCVITKPSLLTLLPALPGHVRYVASVGKCQQFALDWPTHQNSGSLTNLDALVGTEASEAPTNVETQIFIRAPGTLTDAKCYQNLGAGAPAVTIDRDGATGRVLSSNVTLGGSTAAVHTVSGTVTQTLPPNTNNGGLLVQNATANTGNSTSVRGQHSGTVDTSGGFRQAVAVHATVTATRSAGASTLQNVGLQATASGGQDNQAIRTIDGDVDLNTTSGFTRLNKSARFLSEVKPGAFIGDQTDINPGADTFVWLISSTIPVAINSIAMEQPGRVVIAYNIGAQNITLKDQAAALGTATRRIIGRGAADTILTPKTSAVLYYSLDQQRVLILGDTL